MSDTPYSPETIRRLASDIERQLADGVSVPAFLFVERTHRDIVRLLRDHATLLEQAGNEDTRQPDADTVVIHRIPMDSSMLTAAGYDPVYHVLEIAYSDGAVWRYHDVPANAWAGMQDAPSAGKYVTMRIKPVYRAERMKSQ
jgi:hypothetical protein